jgi:glycosyltransferase involved in cell wall biosynthesis
MELAKGEFLAFLDADDLWEPGKLSVQMKYLNEHPECLVCLTKLRFFLEPGFSVPKTFNEGFINQEVDGYFLQTMLCRRQVFDLVGKFDPDFAPSEDVDWFSRARDNNVFLAMAPEVMLRKRIHDMNISLGPNRKPENLLRIFKRSVERKRLWMQKTKEASREG